MMTTSGLIEPGIKHIFKDALESELGWNMPVNLQVGPSSLSDHLECRVSFKYQHKEYAKGINIPYKLIEDDQYSIITKQVQALAKATARSLIKGVDMATLWVDEVQTDEYYLDPVQAAVVKAVLELS